MFGQLLGRRSLKGLQERLRRRLLPLKGLCNNACARCPRAVDTITLVKAMRGIRMSKRKYFGTDGIRGQVGNHRLPRISCLSLVGLRANFF